MPFESKSIVKDDVFRRRDPRKTRFLQCFGTRKPALKCSLGAQRHVFYRFSEATLDCREELRKPLYFTVKLRPLWVAKHVFSFSHLQSWINVSVKIAPLATLHPLPPPGELQKARKIRTGQGGRGPGRCPGRQVPKVPYCCTPASFWSPFW